MEFSTINSGAFALVHTRKWHSLSYSFNKVCSKNVDAFFVLSNPTFAVNRWFNFTSCPQI